MNEVNSIKSAFNKLKQIILKFLQSSNYSQHSKFPDKATFSLPTSFQWMENKSKTLSVINKDKISLGKVKGSAWYGSTQ